MYKQDTLKPTDVVVALALAVQEGNSDPTFGSLAADLGISSSTAFKAVRRLGAAGLMRPGTRQPNRTALRQFVAHGIRHAFPPILGREARGVPTAYAAPALRDRFVVEQGVVWPDVRGSERGLALVPLYPQATKLPERAPQVYRMLTLIDAVRIGRARERSAALVELDGLLGVGAGAA